ncbi:MAG TPA: hypothetical protein VFF93_09895 [Luteimonas sp.]|nr:hypothetical protein [Luteimonas sp.]
MFSAADLIDALRKRTRKSLRPELAPGEFPPGWAQWFEAIGERLGRITGATAEAIVAIFLQREPALPPRSAAELNRWQAFATLWRQQWQAPEHEDRRVRMLALVITLLVHVLLLIVLMWLAYVRFTARPAPEGEEVVQVEFIGQGTPEDQGGGPPAAPSAQPKTAAAPRATTAPAAAARNLPRPPSPPTSNLPAAQPPLPTSPAARQPLQVTEKTPAAEAPFVLPPPTPPRIEVPQARVAVPKLQAPMRAVELIEVPPPVRALEAKVPEQAITVPQLKATPTEIPIVAPLPPVQARALPELPVAQPALKENAAPIPLHELPAPVAATQASTASKSTPAATAASTSAATAPAQAAAPTRPAPSSQQGTQPSKTTAGSGPATTPKPGAWPTPKRGDDWGASDRNRPGGNTGRTPGLFTGEGVPRLPAGTAAAGNGLPPGSDHWTKEDFDRAGTWLKRPPNDYEPTRFDKVWVPSETLLEQWVRENIRSMDIPIPGTSKKLHCVVSLLQLGGGCGITDPNINDQEATARPPPDVPFKPDLQEDQRTLGKPGKP